MLYLDPQAPICIMGLDLQIQVSRLLYLDPQAPVLDIVFRAISTCFLCCN